MDGAGDNLLELGGAGGHEVEGGALVAERQQRRAGLEAGVGVAAQYGDGVGQAVADQGCEQRGELPGDLGRGLGEQALGLVERDQQAGRAGGVGPGFGPAVLGGVGQRAADGGERQLRPGGEQLGQEWGGAEAGLGELGAESGRVEQAFGQGQEGVGAGGEEGGAPEVNFRNGAGEGEAGEQARREAGRTCRSRWRR